jgi:uncharacterized spore protein YtfJ
MNTREEVEEQIAADQLKHGFLEAIAEQLGTHVGAKIVYGEPVSRDGVTVIPVAKAMYGFGGGGGRKKPGEDGYGGGGGAKAIPVGYIELKHGKASFQPIHSSRDMWIAALVGGLGGFLLFYALRRAAGDR